MLKGVVACLRGISTPLRGPPSRVDCFERSGGTLRLAPNVARMPPGLATRGIADRDGLAVAREREAADANGESLFERIRFGHADTRDLRC